MPIGEHYQSTADISCDIGTTTHNGWGPNPSFGVSYEQPPMAARNLDSRFLIGRCLYVRMMIIRRRSPGSAEQSPLDPPQSQTSETPPLGAEF